MVTAASEAHPAPHRSRIRPLERAFGLLGAPLAWYLHLCFGYAVVQARCGEAESAGRIVAAVTGGALALLIGIASLAVAWLGLRRTRDERPGGHQELLEVGTGRTRFLAIWSVVLASVFTLAVFVNLLALWLVPPCT